MSWHQGITDDDWRDEAKVGEIASRDWMTEDLLREVEKQHPAPLETNLNGVRDSAALERKMGLLFPVGREFASWKQLQQCLNLMADPWGFVVVHTEGSFLCSFGKKKSQKEVPEELRQRKSSSLKTQVQCPFMLGHSLPGRKAATWLLDYNTKRSSAKEVLKKL